jgi:4-hydroxybenzoate polyprenyltransferase
MWLRYNLILFLKSILFYFSFNWHQQYEKLVEFKRKNGHCSVPIRYGHDKALGRWVVVISGPIITMTKCDKIERT